MSSLIRPGLVLSALVLGLIISVGGVPAGADLIPSAPIGSSVPDAAPVASSDAAQVAGQLAMAGLAPAEIDQRLQEMTPAEIAALAEEPRQVQLAGDAGTIALIVGGIILLGVILYLILAEQL